MTDTVKWCIGLAAVVVLGWLGIHTEAFGHGSATRAQAKIETAVDERLELLGATWAKAQVEGQRVRLSGAAPSAEARDRVAEALLSTQWSGGLAMGGVTRVITDDVTVGPRREGPYAWAAELTDRRLVLTGLAPSEDTATNLTTRARSIFADREIVNRMTVDPTPPDENWAAAATAALYSLGQLATGEARMTDTAITVGGRARSQDNTEAASLAFAGLAEPYAVTYDIDAPAAAPAPSPVVETPDVETDVETGDPLPSTVSTQDPDADAAATNPADGAAEDADAADATGDVETAPASGDDGPSLFQRVARALTPEQQTCQAAFDDALSSRTVRFQSGSSDLSVDGRLFVDELADIARSCDDIRLTVEGHTDATGAADANLVLSQERARAVRARLIAAGVPSDRLVSVGYGEDRPIASNATPEGRARNRRIEIIVTP